MIACVLPILIQRNRIYGNVATFGITDGLLGDDLAQNGRIVDAGGPALAASATTPVPSLGQWAVLMLSLLIAVLAIQLPLRKLK